MQPDRDGRPTSLADTIPFDDDARHGRAGRTCLRVTGLSGRMGSSSCLNISSSRSAISSATSRRAVRHWCLTAGASRKSSSSPIFLSIGKVALRRVAGVFPDGTPFRMPDDDPLPKPLDVGTDVRDQILHLAVPLRRAGELDVDREAGADELVRHEVRELQARNDVVEQRGSGGARSRHAAHAAPAGERGDAGLRLHTAHAHRRMPRRQAGRAQRALHSDGHACAIGRAAGVVHQRAAGSPSSARRSAGRARGGDRKGSGGRVRRLSHAPGHQQLRAVDGALRGTGRSSPREAVSGAGLGGGRAGDVHRDGETAAEVSDLSPRAPAGVVRAGDRSR